MIVQVAAPTSAAQIFRPFGRRLGRSSSTARILSAASIGATHRGQARSRYWSQNSENMLSPQDHASPAGFGERARFKARWEPLQKD